MRDDAPLFKVIEVLPQAVAERATRARLIAVNQKAEYDSAGTWMNDCGLRAIWEEALALEWHRRAASGGRG